MTEGLCINCVHLHTYVTQVQQLASDDREMVNRAKLYTYL